MLDLFLGLKRLIKKRHINIDNAVFRLHWLFTTAALLGFSLVLTGRQYVGNPIYCMENNRLPEPLVNTYCWISSTFIIPEINEKSLSLSSSASSSLSSNAYYNTLLHVSNTAHSKSKLRYQTYYQWVSFALFVQGLCFYFPYYLWKIWESGLIKSITLGLQIALISDEERGRKRKILIDYFHRNFGTHRLYAMKYFLCELLCLINVIAQFTFTNWFLNGEFSSYGLLMIDYIKNYSYNSNTLNPMMRIFPRMTKCRFQSYGHSGDINNYDILCMLPLNVINEKIYLLLWFWFILMTILLIIVIFYRIFILFGVSFRAYFLKSRCRLSKIKNLHLICTKGNIGDWFLFYMLANNLDPIVMREITDEVGKRLLEKPLIGNNNGHISVVYGHDNHDN